MIRSLHPGDLIRLSFSGLNKLPNHAKPISRIGEQSLSLRHMLPIKSWLNLNSRRHIWVQTKRLKAQGLASAQRRSSPFIWEIDHFILAPELVRGEIDLLHALVLGAGRKGVDKVFFRLEANSPLLQPVQDAGFTFYTCEYLYCLNTPSIPSISPNGYQLRPKNSSNDFAIFQIYNCCFPLRVREAEGITLDDWRQTREPVWKRGLRNEYLLEDNGATVAWIYTGKEGKDGYIDVMVRPGAASIDTTISIALSNLGQCNRVWCMASEYQADLCRALEKRGFAPVSKYATAVRQVTAKVRRPSLVPIGAK